MYQKLVFCCVFKIFTPFTKDSVLIISIVCHDVSGITEVPSSNLCPETGYPD